MAVGTGGWTARDAAGGGDSRMDSQAPWDGTGGGDSRVDSQVPEMVLVVVQSMEGCGAGGVRAGLLRAGQSQGSSAHLALACPVFSELCPAACAVGAEAFGDSAIMAEAFAELLQGLGWCWAGPAPLWVQGSSLRLQEQMGGGHRGGHALCPPCVSQVSPAPCWQYCSAGEDTTVQFRHCRFLICLFIIQKLAHILMNP